MSGTGEKAYRLNHMGSENGNEPKDEISYSLDQNSGRRGKISHTVPLPSFRHQFAR
jgi:hypothetical protein